MSYYPDNRTEKELEALEKRIAEVFKEAEKDLDKEVKEYFAKFKLRDKEMQALVDAGEMTKAEYQQWRLTQIGRGKRFEALRDKVAERYTKANEVANAYVNDMTPSIYSLNRNYEAYQIEKTVGSCDFTMWDESTVRRLLVEQPDLMPYYPPSRALNRGIDLAYGKDQITKHVTSGIIRGLAPGKIANELMSGITTMNRDSAVRAARTGITAAQNAGRMDSYIAAEKMGIQIKRRWMCTKDARTRLDHGLADGQIVVGTKQPFIVGGYKMMFPGDKSLNAPGHEIYNCRCTTRTVEKDGIEAEPRQMRVRNANGEWELVNEMTYSEWVKWKETGKKPEAQKQASAKKKGQKPLENSGNRNIIKMKGFNTTADPMREVTGAGLKSHPEETKRIVNALKAAGAEIDYRDNAMCYQPSLTPGRAGRFVIDPEASYSAWKHEETHFLDDKEDGYPGFRIFQDTERCIQREVHAYDVEIELANEAGRPDIAERLEELKRKEVARYYANNATED